MLFFKRRNRKQSPAAGPVKKMKMSVRLGDSLATTEVPMIDEKGREVYLHDKPSWPRREIDMAVFRMIKRALQLKKEGKFYGTERDIAHKFKVSTTTIMLIRRASSLKNYKEQRRKMSKPEVYDND